MSSRASSESGQRVVRTFRNLVVLLVIGFTTVACGDEARPADADRGDEPDPVQDIRELARSDLIRDAIWALERDDRDEAARLIREGRLTEEPWGATLIEVAECDSSLVAVLLDDVGVSPSSRDRFGAGLVHVVTYPYPSEQSGCEPDETTATLRVLLERGADPCAAPVDAPDQVPALRAEEWGLPDESVELLREHAQEC